MSGAPQVFALAPTGVGPYLIVGLVAVVSGVLLFALRRSAPVPRWGLVIGWAVIVAMAAVPSFGDSWTGVTVGAGNVELQGLGSTLNVPLAALDVGAAQLQPRDGFAPYYPTRRIHGSNAPGLLTGRWKLRDGRIGWVYVTDQMSRLAVVPFRGDSALVLSLVEPEAFMRALREAR